MHVGLHTRLRTVYIYGTMNRSNAGHVVKQREKQSEKLSFIIRNALVTTLQLPQITLYNLSMTQFVESEASGVELAAWLKSGKTFY